MGIVGKDFTGWTFARNDALIASLSQFIQYSVVTQCPEKNEATSILGITLTNLNTVS